MGDKIKLYDKGGKTMEVEDTPQRRAWAAGKGYCLDKPPGATRPLPKPKPPASSD